MSSPEEVISSKDPDLIKRRRGNFQGMMTTICKNLGRLLVKTAGRFDHEKIQRTPILEQQVKLKELQGGFEILHQAFQEYREQGKDVTEEAELVEKQDQHYFEVFDKIHETLHLVAE